MKTTQNSTATTSPNVSAQSWQNSLEEGKGFFQRNETDKAVVSFQNALKLFPAISDNDPLSLLLATEKAKILENIAKAYILKKDYKNAATNCIEGQKFFYQKLTDKFSKMKKVNFGNGELVEIVKSTLDMTMIDYDLLISQTSGAIELNKRCLNYFPNNGMTTDEMMLTIGVGTLKLATAEFVSEMLYTTSSVRLSLSQLCREKGSNVCGVNSTNNQISKYSNRSLEDINKAIEYAPALKKLYLQRAEVYRYLGKTDLALADQTKANQMK